MFSLVSLELSCLRENHQMNVIVTILMSLWPCFALARQLKRLIYLAHLTDLFRGSGSAHSHWDSKDGIGSKFGWNNFKPGLTDAWRYGMTVVLAAYLFRPASAWSKYLDYRRKLKSPAQIQVKDAPNSWYMRALYHLKVKYFLANWKLLTFIFGSVQVQQELINSSLVRNINILQQYSIHTIHSGFFLFLINFIYFSRKQNFWPPPRATSTVSIWTHNTRWTQVPKSCVLALHVPFPIALRIYEPNERKKIFAYSFYCSIIMGLKT